MNTFLFHVLIVVIISCIKAVAAKMELKIQFNLVDNKTHSGIGGKYKGLVLSCS